MAREQLRSLKTKGFYTKYEMRRLCSCLGYPSDLFINCLPGLTRDKASLKSEYLKYLAGEPMSERTVKHLLDYKTLLLQLEKKFNRNDAKYNIKVITKAMWLLRHQKMTFDEIAESRIAFNVYCCEDNSGLEADVNIVLSVLKMLDKVISPSKLECEIQKQQHIVDVPSRIQLYEFFSLILLTRNGSDVESEMHSDSTESMGEQCVSLPDIDQAWMTPDQKKLAYLDQKYKQSLYKEVHPTPVTVDTKHTVSAAPRRDLRALAQEQLRVLSPSLELSQSQLHQVRGGHIVLSTEQYRAREPSSKLPLPCPRQDPAQLRTESKQSQYLPKRKLLSSRSSPTRNVARDDVKSSSTNFDQEIPLFDESSCFKSVVRARKALQISYSSISHQIGNSMSADSIHRQEKANPCLYRPMTAPEVEGERPWLFDPVVTSDELERQEGRINALRWASLRHSSRIPLKTPPSRKLSSRVRFHRPAVEAADKGEDRTRCCHHSSPDCDVTLTSLTDLPNLLDT